MNAVAPPINNQLVSVSISDQIDRGHGTVIAYSFQGRSMTKGAISYGTAKRKTSWNTISDT